MTVYYTITRREDNSRAEKDKNRQTTLPRLLEKLQVNPHQDTKKDTLGRLFLPLSPTIDISLSHADLYTVYAASNTRIGIDMECPDSIRDPEALARRFFTDAEQRAVQASDNPRLTVCEIWTKKEALAKYIGTGLSKNLHLDTTKSQEQTVFHTFAATIEQKTYVITVCTHKNAKLLCC